MIIYRGFRISRKARDRPFFLIQTFSDLPESCSTEFRLYNGKFANNRIEILVLKQIEIPDLPEKWPVPGPSGKSENFCKSWISIFPNGLKLKFQFGY